MKSDPRDYRLDIRSEKIDVPDQASFGNDDSGAPFISVLFSCCQAYQRVYLSADGTQYAARCPRCLRAIRFKVGSGGTSQRTFIVE